MVRRYLTAQQQSAWATLVAPACNKTGAFSFNETQAVRGSKAIDYCAVTCSHQCRNRLSFHDAIAEEHRSASLLHLSRFCGGEALMYTVPTVWQSEEGINARRRDLTRDVRTLRHELRSLPGAARASPPRGQLRGKHADNTTLRRRSQAPTDPETEVVVTAAVTPPSAVRAVVAGYRPAGTFVTNGRW